jgi:hypothetical protein
LTAREERRSKRWGSVAQAVQYSGRSRSRLYQWAAMHPRLFLKDGASVVVDFDQLDAIMTALPSADIKVATG